MDPEAELQATSEVVTNATNASAVNNVDDILSARLAEADQALVDIDGDTISQIFKRQPLPSDRPALSLGQQKDKPDAQIKLNHVDRKLWLTLPIEIEIKTEDGATKKSQDWHDLLEQVKQSLGAAEKSWSTNTLVYLQTGDRLLDARQLQELAEILTAYDLVLHSITTQRRQSAVNAATAGYSVEQGAIDSSLIASANDADQGSNQNNPDAPLYVTMTIRSGAEIVHPGSVIIFGDVNAGAEIMAAGDILVWGKLKGKAHAGIKGDSKSVIMALHMEATQLRIADFIARVDTPATNFQPEIAYVTQQGAPGICIVHAAEYASLKDTDT
ncbi:septum site-determining protein MinC [Thalassoporum mexicanum PCC 7367]|nr:septum site-determining protein MinC [Pseudanabaena sp. PCC 7367]AFY68982.1 septum site-determining protein MinC [Pseudanabaena sp. PCC 7367]